MKKIFLIFSALFITVLSISAQLKEGHIKYDIDITTDNPEMEMAISMMENSKLEIFFNRDLTKSVMQMGTMMNVSTVTNGKTGEVLLLMGGMVGNNAIQTTLDELEEEKGKSPKVNIELINESKTIQGYSCKKAIIKDASGSVTTYWYTKEIEISKKGQSYLNAEVPGFPMEFEMNQGPMKLSMKVTSFKKVADKSNFDFSIPEGYNKMSKDQLKTIGM